MAQVGKELVNLDQEESTYRFHEDYKNENQILNKKNKYLFQKILLCLFTIATLTVFVFFIHHKSSSTKIIFIDNNSFDSVILKTKEQIDFLKKRLSVNGKEPKIELVMRATRDGGDAQTFHKLCDGIKGTISIFKTKKGNIFGGYTCLDWGGNFGKDKDTFLFNVNNMKIYNAREGYIVATPSPFEGPSFMKSFLTRSKFLNKVPGIAYDICKKQAHFEGIEKPREITNGEYQFEIVELEVFKVTYM